MPQLGGSAPPLAQLLRVDAKRGECTRGEAVLNACEQHQQIARVNWAPEASLDFAREPAERFSRPVNEAIGASRLRMSSFGS